MADAQQNTRFQIYLHELMFIKRLQPSWLKNIAKYKFTIQIYLNLLVHFVHISLRSNFPWPDKFLLRYAQKK